MSSEPSDKRARLAESTTNACGTCAGSSSAPSSGSIEEVSLMTSPVSCAVDGPALLAKYGVFSINCALKGETLTEAKKTSHSHTQEILQIFYVQQALGNLGSEQFREINCRDGGRFDIRHRTEEPPLKDLSQNGAWMTAVKGVLGEDVVLLFCGVVLARGGSAENVDQAWHQDGGHLFPGSAHLSCHCLNVFLPLVDISEDNGPTQFILGSHREDAQIWSSSSLAEEGEDAIAVSLTCDAGTAIVFDYRILHRGSANMTSDDRPCLYFTYAKPWFKDHQNLRGTKSILALRDSDVK